MGRDRPDPRWKVRDGPPSRPPWWPEDEPFPPRTPRRGMRRRFLRRVALLLALVFGLIFVAHTLVGGMPGGFEPDDRRGFGQGGGFFGLIILIAGFLLIARAVRSTAAPLGDVMEAAEHVAAGDYSARVEERGPREVRRLARSFNAMTERLGSSEEQRRRLLADIAHELRTPLSVIQGNVEGLLDGVYQLDRAHLEPVLEETKVLSRLLDDLQTLSTAQAGVLQLHREPVEPQRLIEDAVAAFRSPAADAGVRVESRIGAGLPVLHVDTVRIGQVLSNLLHNAIRHTPAGGSVVVAADLAQDGRLVRIEVRDTGPGIPPDVLPHVFERLVKAADSGGAGLGLAIAKGLVEAHGGEISAESAPGDGTIIRFVLPVEG